ncbi:putative transient-receptor-potential-like protein-like [Apostichopus japonicus]|uniref:Putative transient-receptor-potential-like protein-like n=1 Tax=Stichopus japonicus TaxID=307972 RepID=A0A2G8JRW6_STIJA|nr:putative transient-receptor-potential-like protein-like [Apostichopus japonicus]
MNHSASFVFFLLLLVYASTTSIPCVEDKRGRGLNWVEAVIMIFAFGMIWAECKQLWEEGLKAYIRQWWNWLDFIMLSMYLCTFSLRFATMIMINGTTMTQKLSRENWPKDDPTLLAEGIFSIANVFSFARIIFLFQANPYLGPLQISLGCMLIDICKFLLIFFLVLLSFACGMNKLYSNCEPRDGDATCGAVESEYKEFSGLGRALLTLVWALFGLIGKDVILIQNDDSSLEIFGELLFLSYQLVAIVVLLNMLIAMMSSSFQNIENHADVEWKFARSKLWMSYFDEGSTLPPPFNLIISPKSVYYCYQYLKRALCSGMLTSRRMSKMSKKDSLNGNLKGGDGSPPTTVAPELRYQDVMKRLVSRYIHRYKAKQKADGVNEDDLNEIKQDISSLRYELREDRKREEARGKFQFDDIKKELVKAFKEKQKDDNVRSGADTSRGRATNKKLITSSHSTGDGNSYRGQFTEGSSPIGGSNHVTKRDLENVKWDIVSTLKDEIRNSFHESSSQHSNVDPSRLPNVSPPPPTPPPRPNYFRPIDGNQDVDIHGIRQHASTMGIRYHISPSMRAGSDEQGGTATGHSLTRL